MFRGFLVLPRAIFDEPETIIARRSCVSQIRRLGAGLAGLSDPLRIRGVLVLSPIRLSQAGVRQAIVRVLGKGVSEYRNGILDRLGFMEFFKITSTAQVVGVSAGGRSALIGERLHLLRLKLNLQHPEHPGGDLRLQANGVG